MHLLFMVLDAGLGGHTRTAVTIAEAMRRQGHTVTFIVADSSITSVIESAEFPMVQVRYRIRSSLTITLRALIKSGSVDAVHAFSLHGLASASSVCRETRTPVFWTNCGGPPIRTPLSVLLLRALRLRSAIFLSEENALHVSQLTGVPKSYFSVIPARIDISRMSALASDLTDSARIAFRNKYEIPMHSAIVLRIARVAAAYEPGILHSLEAVAQLRRRGLNVCFLHIGYVVNQDVFNRISRRIAELNAELGLGFAATAQDESTFASQYVPLSSIVIGVGRSAFEGMALKKPTIVVGFNGFAGLVNPETAPTLAKYNFSGRGFKQLLASESIERIRENLETLLTNDEIYNEVAKYGYLYAREELDVTVAATRYIELYQSFQATYFPNKIRLRIALGIEWLDRMSRTLLPRKLKVHFTHFFSNWLANRANLERR